MNVHPSIFYTRLIRRSGRGGAEGYPSGHRGTPWTGRQFITGPHTQDKQPHTRSHSHSLLRTILELPINLTCMFLDGRRRPEYLERTHTYIGRTCKLHTERPQLGFNQEPSCSEATVVTTTPACSLSLTYMNIYEYIFKPQRSGLEAPHFLAK